MYQELETDVSRLSSSAVACVERGVARVRTCFQDFTNP